MSKDKPTFWDWVFKAATPTIILGGLVMVTLFYAEIKELVFPDVETRINTVNHMNMEVNAFELIKQAQDNVKVTDTLSKRTDTTIQYQRKLIEGQESVVKLLDSLKVDGRKKFVADSLFKIEKLKSINAREYKMDEVLRFQKEILDSLKN